ncbi:hypothetical protein C2S53_000744 [Perilla frutescens var. hirtella]|uniref:C2H2-type domain-containing protein n=1 Tax=Perilla frutescens var. hirtella TaxID=608512 RepID=A0AAD4J5B4_PERFH|nr:hypothetical protein C2S53_000744 [Perilla frutescens var. hirtella]
MEHHSSSTHYLMLKFPAANNSSMNHYFQESLVWPPRSYRCSFCRREFRSAQALGGHMNVHRRDRARLKQSPPPPPTPTPTPPPLPDNYYSLIQESAAENSSTLTARQIIFTPNNEVREYMNYESRRRSDDDDDEEYCDLDEDDDFVGSNVVGKRHKLMCSTQEIDLELSREIGILGFVRTQVSHHERNTN